MLSDNRERKGNRESQYNRELRELQIQKEKEKEKWIRN